MNSMMNNTTVVPNKSSKKFDLKEKINEIPNKLGFKIGEVADYVGVKSYVLRYWETEFDSLKPKKSGNGQRLYTRKDIEMALTVRKLLYEDRFSIEGAKAALKRMKSVMRSAPMTVELDGTELTEQTTEEELLNTHKPAAEVVLNKAKAQQIQNSRTTMDSDLEQQALLHKALLQNSVNQELLQKREREITQFWASSLDYLVEEIQQARKRLAEII